MFQEWSAPSAMLVEVAEAYGMPAVFGHQLVQVEEPVREERVVVCFTDGHEDSVSFVGATGCIAIRAHPCSGLELRSSQGLRRLVEVFSRTMRMRC